MPPGLELTFMDIRSCNSGLFLVSPVGKRERGGKEKKRREGGIKGIEKERKEGRRYKERSEAR